MALALRRCTDSFSPTGTSHTQPAIPLQLFIWVCISLPLSVAFFACAGEIACMKKYFAFCFGETKEAATRATSRHQSRGGQGTIEGISGGNSNESKRYIEETTGADLCLCVYVCVNRVRSNTEIVISCLSFRSSGSGIAMVDADSIFKVRPRDSVGFDNPMHSSR